MSTVTTIKRVRGDSYDIEATLKVNGVAIVLNVADTITFNYSDGTTTKTINAVIVDAVVGKVKFSPSETDFTIAGSYRYDIQRIASEKRTTHIIGQLILEDDVGKS